MSATILLTRRMLPADLDYIRSGLNSKVLGKYSLIVPGDYSESSLCALSENADIFLGPYVTEKLIESAPNLKMIQIPWTGMDTFDFSVVQGKNILVCNTHTNAEAVAELGIGLLFDLLKKISYHDRKMRVGSWNREQAPMDLSSEMISNQKVCVIGCGTIGSRMACLLNAFGCDVWAVDKKNEHASYIRSVYSSDMIDLAVADADVVVSTVPLTSDTRNLINERLISKMKDGVRILNMSRAQIIDEDALFRALVNGKVAGFASDVWWNPPPRGESAGFPSAKNNFGTLENVVLSPHRAGFVKDCLPHLDGAIENIIRFCNGEQLKNIVDIYAQY